MKKLLLSAVCIVALPMCFSPSLGEKPGNSAQLVAMAGHVVGGNKYCDCGPSNCICGPGETAKVTSSNTVSEATPPAQNAPTDLGTEALFALAAILLWLRLRA
jgi:hypothetical protein